MLTVTKIFHFEMAHAIHDYPGSCRNIHGHSYELHVTVSTDVNENTYIPATGFVIDFKDIKRIVSESVVDKLDHRIVLSDNFISKNPGPASLENIVIFEAEPTAENLLVYIKEILYSSLPEKIKLVRLKLFETKDSYAAWQKE